MPAQEYTASALDFASLGLPPVALEAVGILGYEVPTPVQAQAIPLVLDGRDIIAAAKTGTGKTAAFALPAMARLGKATRSGAPTMLVVTPTRELALQICEVCTAIAGRTGHKVASVVGGVAAEPQAQALVKGVDVLIATPGRLLDHMAAGVADLGDVEVLVLDEADRMLDMGFLPDMRKIAAATPAQRQTLLFSATIDRSIRKNMDGLLHDPELVQIAQKGETADTVEQFVVHVPQACKFQLLQSVLSAYGDRRVLIFTRTRGGADTLYRRLGRAGYQPELIHSNRHQNQRKRALESFATGYAHVLVATDVLSRGIDVSEVSYVVNYDLPMAPEDYIHRIGRTGRAGASGMAISFVTEESAPRLDEVQKLIGRTLPELMVPGFDLAAAEAANAARRARAAAKDDPEIAAAVKEMKAKARRQRRAKEREEAAAAAREAEAAFADGAKPAKKPKPAGKPKTGGKPTGKPKVKPAGKTKPAGKPKTSSAKPKAKPSGKPKSPGKQKSSGSSHKSR